MSIYNSFERGLYCIGVFLDLSKAFDTLDRNILLKKLSSYGIVGTELRWFVNYFKNRQQYVVCKGEVSSKLPVMYGTAQGSVLGPLLFLIYINDVIYSTRHVKYLLFADDTNLFFACDDLDVLYSTVRIDLALVFKWLLSNKLTLNNDKTHYILFHRKQKRVPVHNGTLSIGEREIERVCDTKFLGVIIDESLLFKSHIALVTRRISKFIGIFYKIRDNLNTRYLRLLYKTLVLPSLMYCNSVWGAGCAAVLNPLVLKQKKLVRVISYLCTFNHTDPLFSQLKLLKIKELKIYTV